jgi:hypothetical protein
VVYGASHRVRQLGNNTTNRHTKNTHSEYECVRVSASMSVTSNYPIVNRGLCSVNDRVGCLQVGSLNVSDVY